MAIIEETSSPQLASVADEKHVSEIREDVVVKNMFLNAASATGQPFYKPSL